jgi:hypothetical protein
VKALKISKICKDEKWFGLVCSPQEPPTEEKQPQGGRSGESS